MLGRITALHDIDIDEEIVDTLRVIEHRVCMEDVNVLVSSSTGHLPGDTLQICTGVLNSRV